MRAGGLCPAVGAPFGSDGVAAWWPDWRGARAVIVASGPSAGDTPIDAARGNTRIIAINTSWHLCPWADALYACDAAWWREAQGAQGFQGLKISQDQRACDAFPDVRRVWLENVHEIRFGPPGQIGSGGNGGFQALNLAVQFGCRDIALVGYDMRLDRGLHWHGVHAGKLTNPREETVRAWVGHFGRAAPTLAAAGVRVVNCSSKSALACWPKMELTEWLSLPDPAATRARTNGNFDPSSAS